MKGAVRKSYHSQCHGSKSVKKPDEWVEIRGGGVGGWSNCRIPGHLKLHCILLKRLATWICSHSSPPLLERDIHIFHTRLQVATRLLGYTATALHG